MHPGRVHYVSLASWWRLGCVLFCHFALRGAAPADAKPPSYEGIPARHCQMNKYLPKVGIDLFKVPCSRDLISDLFASKTSGFGLGLWSLRDSFAPCPRSVNAYGDNSRKCCSFCNGLWRFNLHFWSTATVNHLYTSVSVNDPDVVFCVGTGIDGCEGSSPLTLLPLLNMSTSRGTESHVHLTVKKPVRRTV